MAIVNNPQPSCELPSHKPSELPLPQLDIAPGSSDPHHAIFAGGCFWCTEAVFEQIAGVSDVVSGYSGDIAQTANYEAVCGGGTNHAEAIRITYDPSKVTFGQLLRVFFATHDPTTKDRQGPDWGRQYRSAIFYQTDDEKRVAEAYIKQLDEAKVFPRPIVTTLEPLTQFFPAEGYHQDFARENPTHPYIRQQALPKVAKVREKFNEMVK
jgi:peptide-methionine (S)-S-oxide reductase